MVSSDRSPRGGTLSACCRRMDADRIRAEETLTQMKAGEDVAQIASWRTRPWRIAVQGLQRQTLCPTPSEHHRSANNHILHCGCHQPPRPKISRTQLQRSAPQRERPPSKISLQNSGVNAQSSINEITGGMGAGQQHAWYRLTGV